jgi:hypothetical protein
MIALELKHFFVGFFIEPLLCFVFQVTERKTTVPIRVITRSLFNGWVKIGPIVAAPAEKARAG